MADDTRSRLIRAARATVVEQGLAAATARTIAARAGVNQALVFYHFHTVTELIGAASDAAVDEAVADYRETFAGVQSLGELVAVGRELRARERTNGNVAMMAQLLAGGQHDTDLADRARYAMTCWQREVEVLLRRLLPARSLAGVLDVEGLTDAICAGFVGLELYDGVDALAADRGFATIEQLARLVEVVNQLPPVATRALRRRARKR